MAHITICCFSTSPRARTGVPLWGLALLRSGASVLKVVKMQQINPLCGTCMGVLGLRWDRTSSDVTFIHLVNSVLQTMR